MLPLQRIRRLFVIFFSGLSGLFVLISQLPVAAQTSEPHVYLPIVIGNPATGELPAGSQWLRYLNRIRGLALLPAVRENASYSDGAFKHARYMVKNDLIEHQEDAGLPYYTPEGHSAAQASNLMVSTSVDLTDEAAIDSWILGPFHGVGLLDPQLRSVGFGSYREADGGWQMGAALNVISGLGALPSGFSFPLAWPADGTTTWLTAYTGGEFPDPLASCPGYTPPSGAPIYFMIGSGSLVPVVTASSLARDGTQLEHCVYTEQTYTNTRLDEPGGHQLGRATLASRDAVVLMPREVLLPGSYTVQLMVNGVAYEWSFVVAPLEG
jgi:hypothetical protein